MKDTKHNYKGYEIIGTTYVRSGSEIFNTGHYRENTVKRNYNIKKNGKFVINPNVLFERLKDAKEEIDRLERKNMNNVKAIKVDQLSIEFEGGITLTSDHSGDCCESHWLSMSDLTMADFDGLEFDFTRENFFKKIDGYGIELFPIKGHSIRIPGYGDNNGYYSSNLTLVISGGGINKEFDISECQDW